MELYGRVRRACHVEGMSERAAARHFGIDRKTVSKILKHSVPPLARQGMRSMPERGISAEQATGTAEAVCIHPGD